MKAVTDYPVHELIASRWSPYSFANRSVSDEDLRSIFEAARWASSSYNEQPWSFLVAKKEEADEFGRLLSCLVEANQKWAKSASVLALGISRLNSARNNEPNRAAIHDLGLALGIEVLSNVPDNPQQLTLPGLEPGSGFLEEVQNVLLGQPEQDTSPLYT